MGDSENRWLNDTQFIREHASELANRVDEVLAKFASVRDVAAFLRVSERDVRVLPIIDTRKKGGQRVYDRDDVKNYLEAVAEDQGPEGQQWRKWRKEASAFFQRIQREKIPDMFRVGYDDKPVVAAWLRYAMIHSMRVDRPDMFTEGEELDALDALRNALPKNPVYMKRQKALGEPLNEGLKEEARLREQPMELTKQQLSRVALYMAIGGVGSDVLWRGSEDFGDEELGEEEVRKFLRAGLSREYTMTLCMKDRELFSFSKAQESS